MDVPLSVLRSGHFARRLPRMLHARYARLDEFFSANGCRRDLVGGKLQRDD